MSRLPDKPSELIRGGVANLEKAEQDPRYVVDMGQWHRPCGEVCQVCLAGASIAFSLGAPAQQRRTPRMYGEHNRSRLVALNFFRCGALRAGLHRLGITKPIHLPDCWPISTYKSALLGMANALEEAGL